MDLDYVIAQLADHAVVIQSLVGNVSAEQARWKPSTDVWSILEVVHHLYDEEREDFRRRLDHVLFHPDQPWPGIDPRGWVIERRYNEQDFEHTVAGFLQERDQSLKWLKGLGVPELADQLRGAVGVDHGGRSVGVLGGARSAPHAAIGRAALGLYNSPT